jgi:uncharacterized membrane protein
VLYTFQTFVPPILSAEGYSIVKSFRYSVVILGAVIPDYVLGGHVVEWLDRKLPEICNSVLVYCHRIVWGSVRPFEGTS